MNRLLFFLSMVMGGMADQAVHAQQPPLFSLQPADSLHPARFWTAIGTGATAYSATMVGLYHAWYSEYPAGPFHVFNDVHEWQQMDKMGHWLMSYQESKWISGGARWAGLPARKAAWIGFAGAQLIQGSFELYDGFSSQWGFSWSDIGFNLLGSGMFLAQELGWREQRILMKMSAYPVRYPGQALYPVNGNGPPTTLQERADALYGRGPVNLFLKNYNTLVVWASFNPRSFTGDKAGWIPRWLNIAVGMGADNLFAGTGYDWQADKNCVGDDCLRYAVDPARFPRTRQFMLSLDIDYSRFRVRSRFVRTVLQTVNIIKFPAPTVVWSNRGAPALHLLYF